MQEAWVLKYRGLVPQQEGLREAICTLGNGVFATRGAAEERRAGAVNYPGNYIAGGYNELVSEIGGRRVVNEDLVNFPNWLWMTMRVEDGPWLDLREMEVLEYEQELHLKEGFLLRRFRVRDEEGRTTAVESRRLVHMEKHHLAAIQWRVVAEDWEGSLTVRSGLDGDVRNENVARYQQLENEHLEVVEMGSVAPEGVFLKVRTTNTDIELAQAGRTRVWGGDEEKVGRRQVKMKRRIAEDILLSMQPGSEVVVEKVVAQFTSRDRGIGECGKAARIAVNEAADFEALATGQRHAWRRLWDRCDIVVENSEEAEGMGQEQLILRLHIFHLLQTASPNTVGRDVGIPARGLHGEAYRGHIFWDELFIMPFFIQRLPSIARSAILYRYYRLDSARRLAQQEGYEGAAYPWQSGSDGLEASQEVHLNPDSGKWGPDHSHLQRHINSAIVYNIWSYYIATGDRAFLEEYGAEIILEIGRFWSSIAEYDQESGRFEIKGVMGPDEYHEKYPGAEAGGVNNNVYTNVTAVWCLLRAREVLERISGPRARELARMLGIDQGELQRWEAITRKMKIVFHDGVISQFEGYGELEEFDWVGYQEEYENIQRLDRILKAEGDTPDRYKVSKQADVTMLLYLFREEEIQGLFSRLGYELTAADIHKNVEYYRARTSHGSTLSRVVFTSGIHRHDREEGSRYFLSALKSDICDVQGGTTQEGVHLGAMAGTVDIVMRYYAGLELGLDRICFRPHMPDWMSRIGFRVEHQGRWFEVDLSHEWLKLTVDKALPETVRVQIGEQVFELKPGETRRVEVEPGAKVSRVRKEAIEEGEREEMAPALMSGGKEREEWSVEKCLGRGSSVEDARPEA